MQLREDVIEQLVRTYVPRGSAEELWRLDELQDVLAREYACEVNLQAWLDEDKSLSDEGMIKRILDLLDQEYRSKREQAGDESLDNFEKAIMLQVLDTLWREHLAAMDYLRKGIHLRGYAQKDPKQEYKREAFGMFTELLDRYKQEVVSIVSKVRIQQPEDIERVEQARREREMHFEHAEAESALSGGEAAPAPQPGQAAAPGAAPQQRVKVQRRPPPPAKPETFERQERKVGRNEPCPCGSGKKYKQCHGKLS